MEKIIIILNKWLMNIFDAFIVMLKLSMPFIICFILYFIIKIVYRYYKYGYKEFSLFRKPGTINFKQEMLFFMLEKINGYRKILSLKDLNSHITIVDETGIYLIYIYNKDGIITGDSSDEKLVVKSSEKNRVKVENPYILIDEDEAKIRKKLGINKIHKYIIINNNCLFDVKYNGLTDRIYYKNFFYKMDISIKRKHKIFNKEDINKYYRSLKDNVK